MKRPYLTRGKRKFWRKMLTLNQCYHTCFIRPYDGRFETPVYKSLERRIWSSKHQYMPLKKRTPVSLIHIDAVSKRLYMMLKKRPFLKKLVCVFLKAYMAVLKRRLYGLVKQMSVSLEAYINGCLETINIWYCKTLIIFVFVFFDTGAFCYNHIWAFGNGFYMA